jgi:hypothetical protein
MFHLATWDMEVPVAAQEHKENPKLLKHIREAKLFAHIISFSYHSGKVTVCISFM